MVLPGRIHEVAMILANPMLAAEMVDRLSPNLPENTEVLAWGDLLPEMREVIAAYGVSRMIIVTILYLATGLGILNTFFMSVMERTREFGILMAQGMRPMTIRSLVLLETLFLGGIALTIGLFCGALMTLYMQQVGIDLTTYITPITYAGGTILPRLHAVFEEVRPPPVGGHALPIDKRHFLTLKIDLIPGIGLAFVLLAAMAVTIILIRCRNKSSR